MRLFNRPLYKSQATKLTALSCDKISFGVTKNAIIFLYALSLNNKFGVTEGKILVEDIVKLGSQTEDANAADRAM